MTDVSILDVYLYDEPIATITRLPGDRTVFAFNDEYVQNENRPTLGLAFKDTTGDLLTDFRTYQTRLMPFFSNLLPENDLRRYLAERAQVNPKREFFLLWVLGADLPGALTVKPADGDEWPTDSEDDVSEEQEEEQRKNALRFSLAGVQLKFSAAENASGGLTVPAQGIGGSWVVKFPSPKYEGVPENEYAMMRLAQKLGMDVPRTELIELNEIENIPAEFAELSGKALAIERFDRDAEGHAVHIEDFAQVFWLYPDRKYERASFMNIAAVIATEGNEEDAREFIRRLVFNTLIGNADMHTKNWSLIYPDRRNPHLSPAYDFVSTIAYIKDDYAALTVNRSKRFDEFSQKELSGLADRSLLPKALVLDEAGEIIEKFHNSWQWAKQKLPISEKVAKAIESHLKNIPMIQEITH
ncbi:MAG: type II toxin-antitoxin system HipA family toxin [Pseudomonadota bacterium]|nr:MAG: type II toxin-antitoxin system HipA family toxin [Pseudomonadota bacterium]